MKEELIKKAKRGNSRALSKIIKEGYGEIYRYFFYRTKTAEDAEDLSQKVFLRVVKNIKKQKGNFNAWLFTIARNLLTDYYRKKGRKEEFNMAGEKMMKIFPADNIEESPDDGRLIDNMLGKLAENQKTAVVLKFLEGHTYAEIAEIMDKTQGAVKQLIYRGISRMRDMIKDEEQKQ